MGSPHHHNTTSKVERIDGVFANVLRSLAGDRCYDWPDFVPHPRLPLAPSDAPDPALPVESGEASDGAYHGRSRVDRIAPNRADAPQIRAIRANLRRVRAPQILRSCSSAQS